jgi:hypothetical protein
MQASELIDMTELALRNSEIKESNLKAAMYPSPGGADEFIALFLWEKVRLSSMQRNTELILCTGTG